MAAILQGMYLSDIGYTHDAAVWLYGHDPSYVHVFVTGDDGQLASMDCRVDENGEPLDGSCVNAPTFGGHLK
jgi:hypothetical protein